MTKENATVYLALIHNPVYNKLGEVITTTVTNYDLHDITRAGRTFGIKKYFIVNHLASQQKLVKKMRNYWTSGFGADYNSNRHESFTILDIADDLKQAVDTINMETGKDPYLVATSAKQCSEVVSFNSMRKKLASSNRPFLILFGTGWGLTEDILDRCDYLLAPIYGRGDYNHLSVRSAASIIMDRLLATPWWE